MLQILINLLCFCGIVFLGIIAIFLVTAIIFTIIYATKDVKKELKK